MSRASVAGGIRRRTLIKTAAAAGILQVTAPFILKANAADTVKIGLCNPLTGTYAALGKNELAGAKLAIDQINAKGGIVGKQAELVVEDSTSGDAGTAVQKTRKLIERDGISFLLGNINSALALAQAQVSNEKGIVHIVPGGHTDAITGATCHWNVFRICNTTQMEANAVAGLLINSAGKKWYYITPDYAFGHTLQAGLEKACARLGGEKVGADLTPLGTTDFSSYLIKAQSANPDVIIFLTQGDDMINAIKQAVQFGLDKRFHLAGAQQELEALEGLPPEARIGAWVFEWYWNQPNVPHVADFVDTVKKATGRVPSARTWFGFAATWSCALGANAAGSLEGVKVAKALEGLKLPPEIGLMPDQPYFRAEDHQLIGDLFVGTAQSQGKGGDDDFFNVTQLVKGTDAAPPPAETGCKLTWPA